MRVSGDRLELWWVWRMAVSKPSSRRLAQCERSEFGEREKMSKERKKEQRIVLFTAPPRYRQTGSTRKNPLLSRSSSRTLLPRDGLLPGSLTFLSSRRNFGLGK
ncbi:hypothetical protein AVEN_233116-1 [Araneus ventricosus]|uniref:Uncharacterized protein n=1 Tax=Araneus ventricosus TaxID=182803 RepID=A0A4Y2MUI4_ARAVE|nr:hypothetical protein AVEN_233116-1 [Araneus ventricosus]